MHSALFIGLGVGGVADKTYTKVISLEKLVLIGCVYLFLAMSSVELYVKHRLMQSSQELSCVHCVRYSHFSSVKPIKNSVGNHVTWPKSATN